MSAEEIKKYVMDGGVAVFTFRSGLRDEFNNIRPLAVPGIFAELAGIEVQEFETPTKDVDVKGAINGTAKLWCDVIEPVGAEIVSTYAGGYYEDRAAITEMRVGKGYVYYVGCDLDDTAMTVLVRLISKKHGIATCDLPDNVERIEKEECIYLLNHNEEAVNVNFSGIDLLTGEEFDGTLDGFGVVVLNRNNNRKEG